MRVLFLCPKVFLVEVCAIVRPEPYVIGSKSNTRMEYLQVKGNLAAARFLAENQAGKRYDAAEIKVKLISDHFFWLMIPLSHSRLLVLQH